MDRIFTTPSPLDPTRPLGDQYPGAVDSFADEMAAIAKTARMMASFGSATDDPCVCDGADLLAAMSTDERLFRAVRACGGTLDQAVAFGKMLA